MSNSPTTARRVRRRAVPGFPGYAASSDGSIWSRRPRNGRGGLASHWRHLAQRPDRDGYLTVRINRQGRPRTFKVHRLVLLAFRGPPPPGHECRHIDGSKKNNRLSNLEWATHQANEDDKELHGTRQRGEQVASSKLTADDVRAIRDLSVNEGLKLRELADLFGVSIQGIHSAIRGQTWKHVGCRRQAA